MPHAVRVETASTGQPVVVGLLARGPPDREEVLPSRTRPIPGSRGALRRAVASVGAGFG